MGMRFQRVCRLDRQLSPFAAEGTANHALGALGDALGQCRGFDLQAEDVGRDGPVGCGLVALGFGDFEGADEAAACSGSGGVAPSGEAVSSAWM